MGTESQISYTDSLLSIYIKLNLIIMNSKLNKTPLFKKKWVYDICCGGGEYSHDNHMANIFRPIRCKMFEIYAIRMDLYKKMKKPGYASREFYNEYRNVEKK